MLEAGIKKFKCATIAEAEMLALAEAPDVLLAYQPVGPKADRLVHLIDKYPNKILLPYRQQRNCCSSLQKTF